MLTLWIPQAALALLVLGALPLYGQSSADLGRRGGFRVGIGYGGAIYDVECTGCLAADTQPDSWDGGHGGGVHVRLGGGVSRNLAMGLEGGLQGVSDSVAHSSTIFHLVLTGQYHPSALHGFHLAGGMGPASIGFGTRGGSVEAYGVLMRVGAGYDLGISERLTITPYVHVGRIDLSGGETRTFGSAAAGSQVASERIVQYGLALTWNSRITRPTPGR